MHGGTSHSKEQDKEEQTILWNKKKRNKPVAVNCFHKKPILQKLIES